MSNFGASRTLPVKNRSSKKKTTGIRRLLRYFHLRFLRLRGKPRELALGMAFGIFAGSMPIMPFQIALAVFLALIFKGSKIAAALGTWISNPLNWYFLYYYSYRIGASLLGITHKNGVFASVMESVRNGEDGWIIAGKIMEAGGHMIAAFLIGGLVLGFIIAPPSYFLFLKVFRSLEQWRLRKGKPSSQ
ncbi:MAG: DUF2062 domain-containing protein [Desulfobacteraceae bacterium]|nr:MAG: DUF2062 domain-containing protein [Desulfobacteraceae bacterium]